MKFTAFLVCIIPWFLFAVGGEHAPLVWMIMSPMWLAGCIIFSYREGQIDMRYRCGREKSHDSVTSPTRFKGIAE